MNTGLRHRNVRQDGGREVKEWRDGLSWGIGLGVIGAVVVAFKGDWYPVIFPAAMVVAIQGAVRQLSSRPHVGGGLAGAVAGILILGVYLAVHRGTLFTGSAPAEVLRQFLIQQVILLAVVDLAGTWLMVKGKQYGEEQRRRRQEARRAERQAQRRRKKKKK